MFTCPQATHHKLYYSYVLPHLLWLNPICCDASDYLFKHLQITQNSFIRKIFNTTATKTLTKMAKKSEPQSFL